MLIVLLFVALTTLYLVKSNANGSAYLHKPTGKYGVGYKTYYLLNNKNCPNVFFKRVNQDNFSSNNKLHCNEIELAVYYPTEKRGSSPYQPIPSLISDVKSFDNNASESNIKQIKNIKSYSVLNAPIIEKQFPLILFSPGYGLPSQEYENIITELVSWGYIVIGVNSQFINGDIIFSNTPSKVIQPETEEDKRNLFRNSYDDLAYAYERLSHKKIREPILDNISWDRVGLLGHSLGAASVARFSKTAGIRAVASLDLTIDLLDGNACHKGLNKPFMHMFSSQMYKDDGSSNYPYLCKDNMLLPYKKIVVISGLQSKMYSMHMNFCDYSTLQYSPSIMRSLLKLEKRPDEVFLGLGNGINITNSINERLRYFFDEYLIGRISGIKH